MDCAFIAVVQCLAHVPSFLPEVDNGSDDNRVITEELTKVLHRLRGHDSGNVSCQNLRAAMSRKVTDFGTGQHDCVEVLGVLVKSSEVLRQHSMVDGATITWMPPGTPFVSGASLEAVIADGRTVQLAWPRLLIVNMGGHSDEPCCFPVSMTVGEEIGYELVGACVHFATAPGLDEEGHFIALVKKSDKWWCLDDEKVKRFTAPTNTTISGASPDHGVRRRVVR